jgi:hypothetical protein
MRVHKIWAANVRGISTIKSIEPALCGVTIIHSPNESGKTTLSEVLTFLFTSPSTSNDSSIKKLQPIGKDVGPSMGATIEIGPDTYEITKQWLKEKKTELKITGSRNLQLAGPDAQREIDKLFAESLDGTFWELLQVKQAEFNTLVGRDFTDDFLADLQNLLDKISSDSDEENADSLFEKVETAYTKWFTANGRVTTAAGTQGRALSDLEKELSDLKATEIELRRNIAESGKVEEALGKDQVDVEFLKTAYKAQQLNKEILPLRTKVTEYTGIAKEIDSAFEASPLIKSFSLEKFANLEKLYPLELKFSALNLLTIKAIEAIEMEIQGEKVNFLKAEIREVPLEPGLQIVIPGLLEIAYGKDGEDSPNLAVAHRDYEALLTEMDLENWTNAEKLSREYGDLNRKIKQLEILEGQQTLVSLQAELTALQDQMTQFSDWDALITAPKVNFEELDNLRDTNAVLRGQWIQINKNGWDHKLNEALSHIQSIESQLRRLKLQRDAIKKLYETLVENREKSARNVAPVFAAKLNEVAKLFFGEGVDFHVTEDFAIKSRYMDGSSVPVSQLSTGAKEQLAILIRLTLSRLVLLGNDNNEGVPVIFDDEFGHTDPERLKEMAKLIEGMGEDQQFIFMTCYPDKFDAFNIAKKIDLLV